VLCSLVCSQVSALALGTRATLAMRDHREQADPWIAEPSNHLNYLVHDFSNLFSKSFCRILVVLSHDGRVEYSFQCSFLSSGVFTEVE